MVFDNSKCSVDKKLHNFSKYVRRQSIARFLVQYELFKKQLTVKGSIIECGVHNGGGLMSWAKISSTLEPYNYHRMIYGFDTFEGFPGINDIDKTENNPTVQKGMFAENDYNIYEELLEVVKEYDDNRFLNHKRKIELVKGDANVTIPEFLNKNKHVLISLLYLDFDIFEPTVTALKYFLPLMPKGAILAFDELNNSEWPGETQALLEHLNLNNYRLECFDFEPNISFIQL
ncbi:MAG: dTDP-6-deoxy-L-hexose 3-O-methyltransferase [Chitinophagaceae bacterium]|nr:dTDP-6-deoxy-L-hexose 3-O-methyltransferase [Chitinophagaceae bacterium]